MRATISPCGLYRYDLWREWDASLPLVGWIMLNPSTADASADDPTIRRCIGFSRDAGYGRMVVCNLFAVRATDPKMMMAHSAPIGPENDEYLNRIIRDIDVVICAWGAHGRFRSRGTAVMRLFDRAGKTPHVLALTSGGQPAHPLYLPGCLRPYPIRQGGDHG